VKLSTTEVCITSNTDTHNKKEPLLGHTCVVVVDENDNFIIVKEKSATDFLYAIQGDWNLLDGVSICYRSTTVIAASLL